MSARVRRPFLAAGLAAACAAPAPVAGAAGPPGGLFGEDSPATLFDWGRDAGCDGAGGGGEEVEPLIAERPDFTNSPRTIGLGVAQVELGYRFTYDGGAGGETRAHSFPDGLLRAGVLANWLELRLGGTEIIERTAGPDPGNAGDRRDGTEGIDLGAKVGLVPQAGALPEVALITTVTFPTSADLTAADRSGAADRPLPGAELVYGWEVDEFLRFAGSSQANRTTDDDGRAVYTEFAQSATVGFTPSDRFGTYAEYYVLIPAGTDVAETEHYADAGVTFLIAEDVQYDAFVGTGLNDAADDFFVGTGLVVRFR